MLYTHVERHIVMVSVCGVTHKHISDVKYINKQNFKKCVHGVTHQCISVITCKTNKQNVMCGVTPQHISAITYINTQTLNALGPIAVT